MINISTYEVQESGIRCHNINCKNLPEYTDLIINGNYFLKQGTICAEIAIQRTPNVYFYDTYCRGCIDEIYQLIKSKLDTKLWAFH
jgi:hypothetical protein